MARERRTIKYNHDVWALLESHAKATGRPVTAIINYVLRQLFNCTFALNWWKYGEKRPAMRKAIAYLLQPEVAQDSRKS